jgi:hypothetical protein
VYNAIAATAVSTSPLSTINTIVALFWGQLLIAPVHRMKVGSIGSHSYHIPNSSWRHGTRRHETISILRWAD